MKVMAAKQLAWLNTMDFPRERRQRSLPSTAGPSTASKGFSRPRSHAVCFRLLAEIDSEVVAEQIRTLPRRKSTICARLRATCGATWFGRSRRSLFVPTASRTALCSCLRLALAENETWGNNATGQFRRHFSRLLLADTAADGGARLSLLDEVADAPTIRASSKIVVDASDRRIVGGPLLSVCRLRDPRLSTGRCFVASLATREEAESRTSRSALTRLAAFAEARRRPG